MKKILFGITSLTLGGAERVLIDIVNELALKYEVTVLTLHSGGELENELKPEIRRKTLYNIEYDKRKFKDRIKINFDLLFRRKHIYNKIINDNFDTEIAFLEGPITRLLAVKNNKVKKITWIHNNIFLAFGQRIKRNS